jgi:hypothetical protein
MPLRDHFHPPLSSVRHWEGLHTRWAASIADALNNGLLPEGYFAEPQLHVGSRVEIDVPTFDERKSSAANVGAGGTATLAAPVWAPPAPNLRLPAIFPDSLEVLVLSSETGPTLVAAVELVSPGNKDRDESRRAFASKCASYLQQGVGLQIVDIVTNRSANMHNELVKLLELGSEYLIPQGPLYAAAYRPVRLPTVEQIEVWNERLQIGGALPVLPLAIGRGVCIPLDLEATYFEACTRLRLP